MLIKSILVELSASYQLVIGTYLRGVQLYTANLPPKNQPSSLFSVPLLGEPQPESLARNLL